MLVSASTRSSRSPFQHSPYSTGTSGHTLQNERNTAFQYANIFTPVNFHLQKVLSRCTCECKWIEKIVTKNTAFVTVLWHYSKSLFHVSPAVKQASGSEVWSGSTSKEPSPFLVCPKYLRSTVLPSEELASTSSNFCKRNTTRVTIETFLWRRILSLLFASEIKFVLSHFISLHVFLIYF